VHAGIEELDLERVVVDLTTLPDQLIEPLPGHEALAIGIDMRPTTHAGEWSRALNWEPTALPSSIPTRRSSRPMELRDDRGQKRPDQFGFMNKPTSPAVPFA
jgi:hypothetical protein